MEHAGADAMGAAAAETWEAPNSGGWLAVLGVVAAAFVLLEVVSGCGRRSRILLKARLWTQVLSLFLRVVANVDYSAVIPASHDLFVDMGLGAGASGWFVGINAITYTVGAIAARVMTHSWSHRPRRAVLMCCLAGASATNVAFALVLRNMRPDDPLTVALVLGLRTVEGIMGGFCGLLTLWGLGVTTPGEMFWFSLMNIVCANVGLFLGPLLSSVVLLGSGPAVPSREAMAAPAFLIAALWGALTVAVSALPAPQVEEVAAAAQAESAAEDAQAQGAESHEGTGQSPLGPTRLEQMSPKARTTIMVLAASYVGERGWTVGMLESSSSMIFEVQFGWGPQRIGWWIGIIAAGSAVLGILVVAVRRLTRTGDGTILQLLSLMGVIGGVGLFNFSGPEDLQVLFFVAANAAVNGSAFIAGGIVESLGNRAHVPGSFFTKENFTVISLALDCVARFAGTGVGRIVIDQLGRNWYAAVQLLGLAASCKLARRIAVFSQGTPAVNRCFGPLWRSKGQLEPKGGVFEDAEGARSPSAIVVATDRATNPKL